MALTDKDKLFDDEAIRDTSNHNSVAAAAGEFTAETIVVHNGLNQQVTFQLQGSADDGTTWIDVGNSFNVAASTNDYQTVTDYFCCYRIQAQCTTSPTNGVLDVWLLKTHGS